MAQPLSASRVPDPRQIALNVHRSGTDAQIRLREGRPAQSRGVPDIVRRALRIGAQLLRVRVADLADQADATPPAASPPYAV